MKNLKQIGIIISTAILGGLSGGVGAYALLKHNLEQQVTQAYEEESQKYRTLTVHLDDEYIPFDDPNADTLEEKFTTNEDAQKERWADKVGFAYKVDNTTETGKKIKMYGKEISLLKGEEYKFSLKEPMLGNNNVSQWLSIEYYNGNELFPSSRVTMMETTGDDTLDTIYINDEKEGAGPEIKIVRNREGELEYRYISEEGAKYLFRVYDSVFQNFKRIQNINERIEAYTPQMIIGNE